MHTQSNILLQDKKHNVPPCTIVSVTVTGCILKTSLHTNYSQSENE